MMLMRVKTLVLASVLTTGCGRQEAAPAATTAAKVANPTTEAALATVTLTPEAEKRLALTVAPVEPGSAQRPARGGRSYRAAGRLG